jgi:hypothetical protein
MKNLLLILTLLFSKFAFTPDNLLAQDDCVNRSLHFDGNDDFLQASFAPVSGDADFSVEAWVKSTATETGCGGTYRRIIGFAGPGSRFELGDCSGELNIFWYDGPNYVGPVNVPSSNLRDGAWHHVAATRQGNTINAYYDGVLVYTDNILTAFNLAWFRVGKWGGGGSNEEWKGLIDEVRVWNTVRSASEIDEKKDCYLQGNEAGLALYYDFNQGIPFGNNTAVNNVEDKTPNGNDGLWSPGYMGSTGFDRSGSVSNFVCPGAPVTPCQNPCTRTLVLQPGPDNGKDAFVHERGIYQNTNFGAAPQFYAMTWTFEGEAASLREYFEFNLGSVPLGATVVSATLDLYGHIQQNGAAHSCLSGNNDAWIRRVTTPWNENTVTWNNQPAVTPVGQVALAPQCTPGTDLSVNLTAMVQDMVNNPSSNYGFQLSLQLENYYRALIYHSSDEQNPLKRPRLTVTYEVPCPCENNLVKNGSFSEGNAPGNLGSGGTLNNWQTVSNTPQVIQFDTCQTYGAIQMWGNQVVGESIGQSVNFVAGGQYQITFCGLWMNTVQDNVRIRFRASVSAPGTYGGCPGVCDEIYLSPVLSTSWGTFTSPVWTATQNYDYLTVSLSNDYNINDGAYVSWARVDDICLTRVDSGGTISVDDLPLQLRQEARLFPNPTTGSFTLEFDAPLPAETQVTVLDLTGRTVARGTAQAHENSLPLSLQNCPAGVYVVRALCEGRPVWSGKVVKE